MDTKSADRFTADPVISTEKKLMACKYCGHLNKRTARFCDKCGTRFGWADYAESFAQPIMKRAALIILLIVPVAVIALVIFSFIAGALGLGKVSRLLSNVLFFGVGGLGLLMIAGGVLFLTYRRRK